MKINTTWVAILLVSFCLLIAKEETLAQPSCEEQNNKGQCENLIDQFCTWDVSSKKCFYRPPTNEPTQLPTFSSMSPTQAISVLCTQCTDTPNPWQIDNGLDCTTHRWGIDNLCNKSDYWTNNKFCQLSCYLAGNGYKGDVCCTPPPTSSPTLPPTTPLPTPPPAPFPTTLPTTASPTTTPITASPSAGPTASPTTASPTTASPATTSPTRAPTPPLTPPPPTHSPTSPPTLPPVPPPNPHPTHTPTLSPTFPSVVNDVPTVVPTEATCTICTNEPNEWHKANSWDCLNHTWGIDNLCNKSDYWSDPNNKFCQLSCYLAGNGYEGDACCTGEYSISSPPTTLDVSVGPTVSCSLCANEPNEWHKANSWDCFNHTWGIDNLCNKSDYWADPDNKFCQFSCYLAGNGYEGDVCCSDSLTRPTAAPTVPPTDSPTAPQPVSIYINSGNGGEYTDSDNITWEADNYYSNAWSYSTANSISGTDNEKLYQSERSGPNFQYNIPLPFGIYDVTLHFADIFSGTQSDGARVFDVKMENFPAYVNLDVFKQAGGGYTALQLTTTVNVFDGALTIEFLKIIDNPKVSGIEIHTSTTASTTQTSFDLYINSGEGGGYTNASGIVWTADNYYYGVDVWQYTTGQSIIGTNDVKLYESERSGESFEYQIPVLVGNYELKIHLAEIYGNTQSEGSRVFTVFVEGIVEWENLDIFKEVGGYTALILSTITRVEDGYLTLTFINTGTENPKVNGIEIHLIDDEPHYAHAVPGGPYVAVDNDNDGFADLAVDGSNSHTHQFGFEVVSWTWEVNNDVKGIGENALITLPTGSHTLTLKVVDFNGNFASDITTVTVYEFGYPDISTISPSSIPLDTEGQTITISGFGFTATAGETTVHFGQYALTGADIEIVNENAITLIVPPNGGPGNVGVQVETPMGKSFPPFTFTYEGIEFISGDVKDTNGIPKNINNPTVLRFGPDGKLYVANLDGTIHKWTLNDEYEIIDEVVSNVIQNSADGKRSILGMAFDPLDTSSDPSVYVAHSKLFHKELKGYTGIISKVSGSNMDTYEHIITGLPVSDHDHGVNGIVFGNNGELYIQVGGNTNAGVPGALTASGLQKDKYFSSATLVAHLSRANFDGAITYNAAEDQMSGYDVGLFATGERNAFGICQHSNGFLYGTDNGPNFGFGKESTGCNSEAPDPSEPDRLNLLVEGGWYGQPNRKRDECIWKSPHDPSDNEYTSPLTLLPSSTDGICEFETKHFGGALLGNLIAGKYQGGLLQISLTNDGLSVTGVSDLSPIGGLDVTQDPEGSLFVAKISGDKVGYNKPMLWSTNDLELLGVFPRRGHFSGGSQLSLFGANFQVDGAPTVSVGENTCSDVQVINDSKLSCTLPPGSIGQTAVVVTSGAFSDSLPNGYRYISGVEG